MCNLWNFGQWPSWSQAERQGQWVSCFRFPEHGTMAGKFIKATRPFRTFPEFLFSTPSQSSFFRFLTFVFFKFYETLEFNMEVNGNHKLDNILKTADRRAKRMKIGTWGTSNSLCRVLFGSSHFTSVWGYSVHFAKFPMLRFSKGCYFHSCHPIWIKFYGKQGGWGGYRQLLFLAENIYDILKCLLIQYHMGLEISKPYSNYSFHPMPAKLYENIGCHGGIQTISFLDNQSGFKKDVALSNFNMGVN